MSTNNDSVSDEEVQQIENCLADYQSAHPRAIISVRRRGSVSIRIRIVDPDFAGLSRVDREPAVWKLLETLPEDVFTSITMLLLITPKEARTSLANLEFDDPMPALL